MDIPRMQMKVTKNIHQLHSEVPRKTVKIKIDTNTDEYRRDSTGLKILTRTYQSSPPRLVEFNFVSNDFSQIYENLRHHQINHRLSELFASRIAHFAATHNSFDINFLLTVTHEKVLPKEDDVVGRLVREGVIEEETSRSLDLESESCSICFENLLGALDKPPTRMSCSHVFHDCCISQWLRRNNSCPICRHILDGQ